MSSKGRKRPPLVAERRYPKKAKATPRRKPAPTRKRKPARRRPTRGGNPVLRLFRSLFGWLFGLLWRLFSRLALVGALIVALAVGYIYTTLPPMTALLDGRTRGSVTLLDRDGQVFAWRGEQFGGQITANTVAPMLKHAVIATEDKRFYRHLGISPRGIAGAIRINLSEGRGPLSGHGGSTITQQTAKLLCLGVAYDPDLWDSEADYEADCRRTTLWRKAKEAVFALAMEAKYSKDEILTIYLNRAYLGAGARGFEAAAQRYFGKSANRVSTAEAAMLAGLLKAPTTYAPTNNLQRSRDRANLIIGLMEDQGYLTAAQAAQARANPAQLSEAAESRSGGYFADWLMSRGPDFLTRDTTEDVIIRTTFDPAIQAAAEEAVRYIFQEKVREGSKAETAVVVMSADGAVRAMVGGRKTAIGGFNRATMARRQTGSAFKPFVYAAALDLGYSPNATVVDEPITIDVPGSGPYSPENYDRKFHGRVTLTEALRHSYNIPAVKVSESVGRENVRRIAADFGLDSDLALGPALALGASESTLIEMTGAYAGILNGGSSVTPYGLLELRLKGDDTALMGQEGGMGERVISRDAAQSLVYMMHQVVEAGTGRRAQLPGWQVAGKTGTTSAARDAWFLGFTADYVAGVWMGYDDNTPLTGVTGSGLPAEIWHETMARVHDGLPPRPLPLLVPQDRPDMPQPQDAPRRDTRPGARGGPSGDAVAERILDEILGIFGAGRN
ncbi:transglycosylase domain-containing protein [Rhodovulum adriaticum]|uniref:peptidoglycan glycosyltransferase n=1 Tax=Rhodovulum adriaticum TaxID=35804 RepID=A0A4R2P0G7_RHOAD|nr:PBP1A family penicillin-binding protein [Rhodovulum adriaticum]MBK1634923.1 glycosyl transferase [Rhodovulum adriaticum]TCP27394.1 1A family penicillin-binding protein [Rhodovulum adriaticum]